MPLNARGWPSNSKWEHCCHHFSLGLVKPRSGRLFSSSLPGESLLWLHIVNPSSEFGLFYFSDDITGGREDDVIQDLQRVKRGAEK